MTPTMTTIPTSTNTTPAMEATFRHGTAGAVTRNEALRTETGKGEDQSTAARVYYTMATNKMVLHDPRKLNKNVRGGLNAAVSMTVTSVPLAAHRVRKAFAKLTEILVGRGLLSQEELDEVLLAAVDFPEGK